MSENYTNDDDLALPGAPGETTDAEAEEFDSLIGEDAFGGDPLDNVGVDPIDAIGTDPYDTTSYAHQGTSPDDTADFLDALEYGQPTGNWNFKRSHETREYYDVSRYHQSEKKRRRRIVVRVVIIVLAVLLVGTAFGASYFVSNINARLTENVTDELRDQLAQPREPDDPFYMLLLGVDKDQGRVEDVENYGDDEHAYRSDSIMLCRIDPKNVKVTMVSIHRDTLVNMGEYGQQKINAAYAFGGPAYATEVISQFADVPISHYGEVDLDRFITIVDQVGGITVNLPVPVYDPEYTELDLPAGEQMLNGTQAALLCRCRHGYDAYGDGDVFRAANQRMVFSAVIKKILTSDPATIMGTITTIADSVTTDLEVAQILDLASQMLGLNVETDIMTGMEPTEGVFVNDSWYEICLVDQWKKMMTRVDQGLPPYDETEGEYDSTAGIAGGVGEEGVRAENAAIAADAAEAVARANGTYVEPEPQITEIYVPYVDGDAGAYDTYVEYDPGYVEEGYVDPGYVDPGYVDPGYVDQGYVDPGYVDYGGDVAYDGAYVE